MKVFQVIFQDEYNNLFELGYYGELEDSVVDINNMLESYGVQITEEQLKLYTSTFSECFDVCVGDLFELEENEEVSGVYIRGFVKDLDEELKRLEQIRKKEE